MERNILIGIDASLVNCAAAIYADDKYEMFKGELLEVVAWIREKKLKDKAYVVIEDPNKNRTVFGMWPKVQAEVFKYRSNRSASTGDVQSCFLMAMKQAQNVGESKAAAKILISVFRQSGLPVITIAPSDRDRADKDGLKVQGIHMLSMPTKTTAEQFRQLTGYDGRSNEHSRDAATLVWGKNARWCEMMLQRQRTET